VNMTAKPAAAMEKKVALVLAEFDAPGDVLHAARAVRKEGYTHFDVHSPFPIHGIEKAMGTKDSPLGFIVTVFALTGALGALAMMMWMNGIDYPFIAGGKPPGAIPSMAPVLFELTILFTAFGTVLGVQHLIRLPHHNHPIFESSRFTAATDDKFFLSVEAVDPKFDVERVRALLDRLKATNVEVVEEVGT